MAKIYHLIERATGKVNDIGASDPSEYADRMNLEYMVNGEPKTRQEPLYQIIEGVCPITTKWTHKISLKIRLKSMLVARVPGLNDLPDDLYLQVQSWIEHAITATNPKTLSVIANKFRTVTPIIPDVAPWLEQAAIECERQMAEF